MNNSVEDITYANAQHVGILREREFMIGYQNDCHSFFLTLLSELHDENPSNGTCLFSLRYCY